jgi:hypothetical protein
MPEDKDMLFSASQAMMEESGNWPGTRYNASCGYGTPSFSPLIT